MEKNTEKNTDKRLKNLKPAWKKGEAVEGAGRPKGQRNFATIYKEAMIMLASKNNTTPEALENEMIANGAVLARKGDFRFYKDTLDRLHGTAETTIKVISSETKEKADKAIDELLKNE